MRSSGGIAAAILSMATVLAACAGSGEDLDANGRPLGGQQPTPTATPAADQAELRPNIESIQDEVFSPQCAICHTGSSAPLGLRLSDADTSFMNLVGVGSEQAFDRLRVAPGQPDESYLIDKLEGRQSVGNRMPNGFPPLPPETIAIIRQWISEGANGPENTMETAR